METITTEQIVSTILTQTPEEQMETLKQLETNQLREVAEVVLIMLEEKTQEDIWTL